VNNLIWLIFEARLTIQDKGIQIKEKEWILVLKSNQQRPAIRSPVVDKNDDIRPLVGNNAWNLEVI